MPDSQVTPKKGRRCFAFLFIFTLITCLLLLSSLLSSNASVFLPVGDVVRKLSSTYLVNPFKRFQNYSTQDEEIIKSTMPAAQQIVGKKGGLKVVLFWTDFFGDQWRSHFHDMRGDTLPGGEPGENRTCTFTTDRKRLDDASAVMFHGRDFNFGDMPQSRPKWQHWVFYLLESPHHSGFGEDAWKRAGTLGLDWVQGYSRKAHVWNPYCHVVPWKPSSTELAAVDDKIQQYAESFSKRPKDAVWFVSNCGTPSQREQVAEKLRAAGIDLDSFGRCTGKNPDDEIKSVGKVAFFSRYRYYVSFENSLCEDYLTEKFGNGINASVTYGMIPLVYGGPGYATAMPNNSVIDVESFKSINDLANYLKLLKEPDQKASVAKYFQWHKTHKIGECVYVRFGFGNLCRKLFAEQDNCGQTDLKERDGLNFTSWPACTPPQPIGDLRQFLGQCHSPKIV